MSTKERVQISLYNILFSIALVLAASSSATQDGVSIDREALKAFYESTDGPNWTNNTNWGSDKALDSWYGVQTNPSGRVYNIYLYNNNLSGKLPAALGNLAELRILELGSNDLSGEIPSELGNLSELQRLDLRKNELEGSIPPELGQLDKLWLLYIHRNSLTGEIPSELGNMSALEWLGLNHNSLVGSIPSELGNLSLLQKMFLNNNSLTGEIPSELGNLSHLQVLELQRNSLTGEIPSELGNLSAIVNLFLFENSLTGNIPPELGDLSTLQYLNLGYNSLTGEIPRELGYLQELRILELGSNDLSGEVPQELGFFLGLEGLHLAENDLTGVVPETFLLLTTLRVFEWYQTLDLEGLCVADTDAFRSWLDSVPGTHGLFCSEPDRRALMILYSVADGANWKNSTNWMTDRPLGEWYGVKVNRDGRVKALNLQKNKLSGWVPGELGNMAYLTRLNLRNNKLGWEFPSSFLDLKLNRLWWAKNSAGLCVRDTKEFRDWLSDIRNKKGPVCAY